MLMNFSVMIFTPRMPESPYKAWSYKNKHLRKLIRDIWKMTDST